MTGFSLRVALAAVVALGIVPPCGAAGAPVSLREVRQGLFAACFAGERDAWMVGELGRIFHTTDAGETWERQDAGTKRPFLAIACLDPRSAWIAGKEGIVYGTSDGGATWTADKSLGPYINRIRFVGPRTGYAIGSTIYKLEIP